MKILITSPMPKGVASGNRVTALRWAKRLRELSHQVRLIQGDSTVVDDSLLDRSDLLLALHARRSGPAMVRYRERHPQRPIILALTGTDLYRDIHQDPQARSNLERADHLVLLQQHGLRELPHALHRKTVVIPQSASALAVPALTGPAGSPAGQKPQFAVCLLANLRPVKDPLLVVAAVQALPADSRLVLHHYGTALDSELAERARAASRSCPRYIWHGPCSRLQALCRLATSRALISTSEMEGGANVFSEAIACGVPILSTRIEGATGLLGADHPGYFPVGDAPALSRLMQRLEDEEAFRNELVQCSRARQALVDPVRERARWAELLARWSAAADHSPMTE